MMPKPIEEYENSTMTSDETFLALLRVAEACILFTCKEAMSTRWNHMERRYDTIVGRVKGKWLLRKKVLPLMRLLATKTQGSPSFSDYAVFAKAFEDALRILVKDGMISVENEYPYSRIRKTYAITPTGVSAIKSYESMIHVLEGARLA
jgi:DNA-binding HxlR family transcriptional regulator